MNRLEKIQSKVFLNAKEIQPFLNKCRIENKKLVFTNGCFDILHKGHIDYLSKAADCGDILIVGLNSDSSVKKLNKGASRPLQNQDSRATILASLFFVDAVVLFEEETPYQLITSILPDVLTKGADYTIDQIVGSDIVLAKGGEVKTISFLEGYSTSAIEQKILHSK